MCTSRPETAPRSPLGQLERPAAALDAILAESPDLVYLCDPTGAFLYANLAGAEAWGVGRVDILDKTWRDLVPVDLAAAFGVVGNKVQETGRAIRESVRLTTRSGEQEFEYTVSPIQPGPESRAVLFRFRDVTALRRAEDALGDREEKYRLLAETSTDMISRHDPAGVYLYASPVCRQLFGYEPAELVGRSAYEFIHPEDHGGVYQVHQAILAGNPDETFTVAFRLLRTDGSWTWCETTSQAVRNTWTGEVVEIHCSTRDISQRKQAEEALRQSEERFRCAFDAAAVGIAMASPDGRWLRVNPALCEILGYAEQELLRMRIQDITHPDDLSSDLHHLERLLAGEIDAYQMEKRFIHKRGHLVWVHLSVSSVRGPDGQPLYQLGLIEDITRRRQAEERLREQNNKLEILVESERQAHQALKQAEAQLVQAEKLTALGQLVAGVAHEINNPLAFVNNNVAVLRRDAALIHQVLSLYQQSDRVLFREDPELLAKIQALCERIDIEYTLESLERLTDRSLEGLRRIRQIVGDLRDFARLDESDMLEVDLNAGIRATVNIISGRAHDAGVELKLDLGELPPVAGSPGKLNQVVLNLLANAIDASPAGGTVAVRTLAEPGGRGVTIAIEDCGRGIDPSIRDRIFDPFFTTKPVGQGTGLGLSLSYGIVRDHGGTISVESTPGQGARFTVFLPLARPAGPGPDGSASFSPGRTVIGPSILETPGLTEKPDRLE